MVTTVLLLAILSSADAVQEQFSAAKPVAPAPAVMEFERHLSTLGRTITSVAPARAALEARMAKVSPGEAEDLLRLFWRWHEQLAEANTDRFAQRSDLLEALLLVQVLSTEHIWNRPLDRLASAPPAQRDQVRRSAPAAFRELEGYQDAGFDFLSGEGAALVSDARFLERIAKSLPEGSLKDYVGFRAREDAETVVNDGGLILPWDGLRRRLVRWEAFRLAHPQLPEAKGQIDREIRSLASFYLFGLSNTPAFDYDTRRLDPELRASYRRFLSENTSSAYHPALSASWACCSRATSAQPLNWSRHCEPTSRTRTFV